MTYINMLLKSILEAHGIKLSEASMERDELFELDGNWIIISIIDDPIPAL